MTFSFSRTHDTLTKRVECSNVRMSNSARTLNCSTQVIASHVANYSFDAYCNIELAQLELELELELELLFHRSFHCSNPFRTQRQLYRSTVQECFFCFLSHPVKTIIALFAVKLSNANRNVHNPDSTLRHCSPPFTCRRHVLTSFNGSVWSSFFSLTISNCSLSSSSSGGSRARIRRAKYRKRHSFELQHDVQAATRLEQLFRTANVQKSAAHRAEVSEVSKSVQNATSTNCTVTKPLVQLVQLVQLGTTRRTFVLNG